MSVLLTLAELYNRKKAKCLKRGERRRSVSIVIDAVDDLSKPASEKDKEKDKALESKWETGGKEGYLSWCMIKSAMKISQSRQTLLGYASSTNTPEMTKPLPEKILHELPDFVLLELQAQCESLDTLSNKPVLLPIDSLLPSKQFRPKVSLNWFKIINYYSRLVQSCFWRKFTLHLPDSDWELHSNFVTTSIYPKTKALFSFLVSHCPSFKACMMPSLQHLSMLPGGIHTSGGTSVHRDSHLVASDTDATVMWYSNPFSPLLAPPQLGRGGAEELPTSDRIAGYFALNSKVVSFPLHTEPHLLGMETYVIHTSLRKLMELHKRWEELGKAVSTWLDAKAALRPISRSPSKQKKAEKSIQPPEEVVRGIPKAVREAAIFLDSKSKVRWIINKRKDWHLD